jgi:predicted DNA-binding WGR domain protein
LENDKETKYLLQILSQDEEYYVYSRTGKDGNKGKTTQKRFTSKETAVREFEKKFKQKTNDEWTSFTEHMFEESEGYFRPVAELEDFENTQEIYSAIGGLEVNSDVITFTDPNTKRERIKRGAVQSEPKLEDLSDVMTLPEEVIGHILLFVDVKTFYHVQLTGKKLFTILSTTCDIFWQHAYNTSFTLHQKFQFEEDTNKVKELSNYVFHLSPEKLEQLQKVQHATFGEYFKSNKQVDVPSLTYKSLFRDRFEQFRLRNNRFRFIRAEIPYTDQKLDIVDCLQVLRTSMMSTFEELVIGCWAARISMEDEPQELTDFLEAHSEEIMENNPDFKSIFYGDISLERNECSWTMLGTVGKMLMKYPKIRHFTCRGGDISFDKTFVHHGLRSLTVVTGGLIEATLQEILQAELPYLQHLELFIGDESYGNDCTVESFAPLLSEKEIGIFPSLQYLGLRNNDKADEFCPAIVKSAILKRIRTLDLSSGTLGDEGAKVLLTITQDMAPFLELLDIHNHFCSVEIIEKFNELTFMRVNTTSLNDACDMDDRSIALGE